MTSEGWRALGEHVRRARKARKQTQPEFAADLGISVTLLRHLENAHRVNYDPGTLTTVELALGWTPGSVELVVGGAEPRYAEDRWLRQIRNVWHRVPPEGRQATATLVDLLAGRPGIRR